MEQDAVTPHPQQAPTRNLLTEFCSAADAALAPVFPSLEAAATTFAAAAEKRPARRLVPAAQDLQHQLRALADRIEQQQAFVLIFGPLKSGKSTFMNAMAGSYVSEVTALPAYPCMVYVSHAAEPEFQLTAYDGSSRLFNDRDKVIEEIERAHQALTARLREVEAAGRSFDPGVDMPSALRRVDVRVPAADLKASGAVLVDTPGLYTRMKFGYDRMTRDFRDAAACAVFIVKTENLFLEQVFAEFEELLGLFSRIFLIVNLDRSKQDLRPDGSLAPSLEHEDPQRILDAFEHLAMSAPLKQAADDGRLRIFPVDLLHAASARLRGEAEAEPGDSAALAEHGFGQLLDDLRDYLDSNEYLHAFMADSLRRGEALLEELEGFAQRPAAKELLAEGDRLKAERRHLEEAQAALQILAEVEWAQAFAEVEAPIAERLRQEMDANEEAEQALTEKGTTLVEEWFKSSQSLADLSAQLEDRLEQRRLAWADAARAELAKRATGVTGKLLLGSDCRVAFERAGIAYDPLAQEVLASLALGDILPPSPQAVAYDEIPVKRGLWDYLLFRSEAKCRRRLFGEARAPKKALSRELKRRRLGDAGRKALLGQVAAAADAAREDAVTQGAARLVAGFGEQLAQGLKELLEAQGTAFKARLEELNAAEEACRAETAALQAMVGESKARLQAWAELRAQFPQHAEKPRPQVPEGSLRP